MTTDPPKSKQQPDGKATLYVVATAEAILTIAAGFLARSAMADPRVGAALSFAVWFCGFLITANGVTFLVKLEHAVKKEVRSILEEDRAETRQMLSVFNEYHSVAHPDLKRYREDALTNALDKLRALTRGEAQVEGDEYYNLLTEKVGAARTVRAVSLRPLRVYIDDTREKNWAHANIKAAEKGTDIERLFILEPTDLLRGDLRSLMKVAMTRSPVRAYVVWRYDIDTSTLPRLLGGGFSIYDNLVVFWDRSYLVQDIGDVDAQAFLSGERPIRPRATVYCAPNQGVTDYVAMYRGLERLVPVTAKENRVEGYRQVLKDIDSYLTKQKGSIEQLQRVEDGEAKRLVNDWLELREELAALGSSQSLQPPTAHGKLASSSSK